MGGNYRFWKDLFASVVSLGTCLLLNAVLYSYLQKYTLDRSEASEFLKTALDHAIPFVPFFIWVYVSYWVLLGLPFFIDVVPRQFYVTAVYARFFRRKIHFKRRMARRAVRFGSWCMRRISDILEFIFGLERESSLARKRKIQIALSYLFVIAISNFIYYLYPIKMLRPDLHSGQNPIDVTIEFLRALYEHDKPNNTLPSQHAAFSALAFLIFNSLRDMPIFFYLVFPWKKMRYRIPISAMGAVTGIWAFLIILSTYFIKQHVIVDSLAGILVAYLAFRFGFSEWLYGKLLKIGKSFVKKDEQST